MYPNCGGDDPPPAAAFFASKEETYLALEAEVSERGDEVRGKERWSVFSFSWRERLKEVKNAKKKKRRERELQEAAMVMGERGEGERVGAGDYI